MTDRDAPIRRYADLFRKPQPPLTLEIVERLLDEVDSKILNSTLCREERNGAELAIAMVRERLRQQMGGNAGG